MTREVMVAVVVTLIVGDGARSARWCAARLAQWAARRIYGADGERAATRSEEWEALISESIPSDISAFCFGVSLAVAAAACVAGRQAVRVSSFIGRSRALLPGVRQARRGWLERRLEEHREASLSLLAAATELRLLLADIAESGPGGVSADLRGIRLLAADVQLRAVKVAMLGPAALAESAGRVAGTADQLARQASHPGSPGDADAVDPGHLSELDQNTEAFQRLAVSLSHTLSGPGSLLKAPRRGLLRGKSVLAQLETAASQDSPQAGFKDPS